MENRKEISETLLTPTPPRGGVSHEIRTPHPPRGAPLPPRAPPSLLGAPPLRWQGPLMKKTLSYRMLLYH